MKFEINLNITPLNFGVIEIRKERFINFEVEVVLSIFEPNPRDLIISDVHHSKI